MSRNVTFEDPGKPLRKHAAGVTSLHRSPERHFADNRSLVGGAPEGSRRFEFLGYRIWLELISLTARREGTFTQCAD